MSFFLTELALHELAAAESCFPHGDKSSHFSPREVDQYNFSKCTITVRLLEFATMILLKGDQAFWKVSLNSRHLDVNKSQNSQATHFPPHPFTASGGRSFRPGVFRADCSGGVRAVRCGLQHRRRGGDEEPPRGLRSSAESSDGLLLPCSNGKQFAEKNLKEEVHSLEILPD